MRVKSVPAAPVAPISDDFLTVKQVAERLHVKPATIYEWTRRRETNPIPHFPISRKLILFDWEKVKRWVAAQEVAA